MSSPPPCSARSLPSAWRAHADTVPSALIPPALLVPVLARGRTDKDTLRILPQRHDLSAAHLHELIGLLAASNLNDNLIGPPLHWVAQLISEQSLQLTARGADDTPPQAYEAPGV